MAKHDGIDNSPGQPVTPEMNIKMHGQSIICGAIAKSTGLPCKRIPMANGRCRLHGGRSTGPTDKTIAHTGNKFALTTGQYETIWFDTLDEQEQDLVQHIDVDLVKQLDDELKLIAVRERRMMMRIKKLQDEHEEYVARAVDMVYGKIPKPENAEYDDNGEIVRKPINVTEYLESKVEVIQRIEEALTKVQDKKTKLLDLKHKIESASGDNANVDVSVYVKALENSGKDLWNDTVPGMEGDTDVE